MRNSSDDKGGFGSGVEPIYKNRRRSLPKSIVRLAVIFVVAILIPVALLGWGDFYQNIIEREPPSIEARKPPSGLGLEHSELDFRVRDTQAGIDQVVVRVEQAGKEQIVFKKDYSARQREDDLHVPLNGKELGLREGEAQLSIAAYDKSFWSNGARTTMQLRVDYTKPEVEVFSDQRNAVSGGSELVFYRLKETTDTFSGVVIGAELYPGFPAKNFDKDFQNRDDIYFTFFPVPLGSEGGDLRVFARDAVGNMTTVPVNYRLMRSSSRERTVEISPDVLTTKIDALYEQYVGREAKLRGEDGAKTVPSTSDEERIERFKKVNEQYRQLLGRALKPIFSKPKSDRYWQDAFARFSSRSEIGFGDRVLYRYQGANVGELTQTSTFSPVALNTPIRASNGGVIIFSDDLGPYGKTVIIDHGFGLTTLYAQLSAMSRLEGDRVERGDVIGTAGESGLASTPGLEFEIRVHGVPVRPIEWWDQNWINDHILLKLRNTKRALGIRIVETLD